MFGNDTQGPANKGAQQIADPCSSSVFVLSIDAQVPQLHKTWRYEFNQSKSGVATFVETKPIHCESMKERGWVLGDDAVEERYEYTNIGVLKKLLWLICCQFSNYIDKTDKKAGMIFSSNVDRRKTDLLIYVKFRRHARIPSLLFGAELFMLIPSLLLELKRCQIWFLEKLFYVPDFNPRSLLLRLTNLTLSRLKLT